MPDIRIKSGPMRGAILTVVGDYKPGDLPPVGYLEWHEWADVQRKAGVKQVPCGKCGRHKTPQELSDKSVDQMFSRTRNGPANVKVTRPVCTKCAEGTR